MTEAGLVHSDGGRPRALLQMDPDFGRVIGVDVGETRIRVEMFDMTMAMRASADYHLDAQQQGIDVVVDRVNAGLASVLADSGSDPSEVLGAGIGVPGVVEHEGEEALVYAQTYGWDAVPLGRLFRPARLPALHRKRGQDDGAGRTMVRRRPRRPPGRGLPDGLRTRREHRHRFPRPGRHRRRGRVGPHHRRGGRPVLPLRLPRLPGGVRGGRAILDRYGRSLPGKDEESALAALVAAGHARSAEILDETALYLGAGIADLVNLFGPERIILGGWAGLLLGERLLPAIREVATAALADPPVRPDLDRARQPRARTPWRWAPPRSRWSASPTARCPPGRAISRPAEKKHRGENLI